MAPEETQADTVLAETLEAPVEAPTEQVVDAQTEQQVVEPKEESVQALRFKTLREARERAERERDELKARLERVEATQRPPQEPAPQEDFSVAPDDLVEGKHLTKYDRDIKQLKKQLETYRQQASVASVESRLQTKYPDFDSIVSRENIEMLKTAYPEIAATLDSSSDLYGKAVSAYTMIKKLGIVSDPGLQKQVSRAQENAAKPRPIASAGTQSGSDGPLSHANAFSEGLTKEVKAQLYREMLEARKHTA